MKYQPKREIFEKMYEEEKEILGLLNYMKNFYKKAKVTTNAQKEIVEKKLLEIENNEKGVNDGIEKRQLYKQQMSDREKPRRESFHNIDCVKCKTYEQRKPNGEMVNKHGWRVYTYYCKKCKISFGDWYPIEEKDQLAWIDNFNDKMTMIQDDDTTYAEKFSFTNEQIEEGLKDREEVAKVAKAMEIWHGQWNNNFKEMAEWISNAIRILKTKKEEIIAAGTDEEKILEIIDDTITRRPFDDTCYTSDEREVLELLKFFEQHYKKRDNKNEMLKQLDVGLIQVTQDYIKNIQFAAHERHDVEVILENREKERWVTRYKVECPNCNHTNFLKPLKEMKNQQGWMCYVFACANCREEFFESIPNNDNDQVKYYDEYILQAATVMENGRTYPEQNNIDESTIKDFKEKSDKLKKYLSNLAVSHQNMLESEKINSAKMKEAVSFFTIQKHQVLNGHKPIGES